MDEVANPYRPGAGTQPPALLGRDALLDQFGVAIRRTAKGRPGKSLMPVGLRGVGKTVLLNRFTEIAEAEGFKTGFIEAPESGEFQTLLANRVRRMLLDLRNERPSAKVLRALRVLKSFAIRLPDGSTITVDVDPLLGAADSGNVADDTTDLLVAAGEAAQDQDRGILLCIDEIQYLTEEEFAAVITAIHRTSQLSLPVIIAGAGLPQLRGLAGEAKSYAERLFDFPKIDSLKAEDAMAALRIPADAEGVDFEQEALELIIQKTHGYPYFLQVWGYTVWNAATSSPISKSAVEAITSDVLDHLDNNFFLVRFDRLTPKEKEYLRAMAELGPGPHRSGDVAQELGVKVESVAPRRSGLITKGMIYSPAHGDTAFTVPLFDEFLKRAMP